MTTTEENNVIENHLFQMDVIRKSLRSEEEIALVEEERNRDHLLDNQF